MEGLDSEYHSLGKTFVCDNSQIANMNHFLFLVLLNTVAAATFVCNTCNRTFNDYNGCVSHAHARGHDDTCLTESQGLADCSSYTVLGGNDPPVWCGHKGGKQYSEDFFISKDSVYVVADGHLGENAARYASLELLKGFTENVGRNPTDIFHELNFTYDHSGAVVTVVSLLDYPTIVVANVGDVRALACCDKVGKPIVLTIDHCGLNHFERQRVEQIPGGFIANNRLLGQLAVTRSIGDVPFQPYVISTPSVHVFTDSLQWEFIVIGTDGLFDALSNNDVISIVRRDRVFSARRLVYEARARGLSLDNVGVAVIMLN